MFPRAENKTESVIVINTTLYVLQMLTKNDVHPFKFSGKDLVLLVCEGSEDSSSFSKQSSDR